MDFKMRMSM